MHFVWCLLVFFPCEGHGLSIKNQVLICWPFFFKLCPTGRLASCYLHLLAMVQFPFSKRKTSWLKLNGNVSFQDYVDMLGDDDCDASHQKK